MLCYQNSWIITHSNEWKTLLKVLSERYYGLYWVMTNVCDKNSRMPGLFEYDNVETMGARQEE